MNAKKAKALRRIAGAFATQTGSDIKEETKKMKETYKATKGKK